MTLLSRTGRAIQIRTPTKDLLADKRKFPMDRGRATTTVAGSATPTATLPTSQSGDYLVVWWRASSTLASGTSVPTGWTAAVTAASPDGSDDICGCFYKLADGTEGTSLTFPNMGTSRNWAICAWAIANAGAPSNGGLTAQAASGQYQGMALGSTTDFGAGTKNYLFLFLGSCEDTNTAHSVSTPSRNLISIGTAATGTNGCTAFGATCRIRDVGFPGSMNYFFNLTASSNQKTGLVLAFPAA